MAGCCRADMARELILLENKVGSSFEARVSGGTSAIAFTQNARVSQDRLMPTARPTINAPGHADILNPRGHPTFKVPARVAFPYMH